MRRGYPTDLGGAAPHPAQRRREPPGGSACGLSPAGHCHQVERGRLRSSSSVTPVPPLPDQQQHQRPTVTVWWATGSPAPGVEPRPQVVGVERMPRRRSAVQPLTRHAGGGGSPQRELLGLPVADSRRRRASAAARWSERPAVDGDGSDAARIGLAEHGCGHPGTPFGSGTGVQDLVAHVGGSASVSPCSHASHPSVMPTLRCPFC